MFNSPMESYHSHYGIKIDLDFLFTAARNTYEAIVALESGNESVARQKWESVDGDALLKLWNPEDAKSEREVPTWPKVKKPVLTSPLAKQPSDALKRKVYERDGYRCRYCTMHVFTRNKGSWIHKLIEAFPALTPGLHLVDGSLKGSGKNGTIKNVDYAKFLWSMAAPDHVIPRSHGGLTDMENLVTSCSGCNYSKGDLTLAQLGVQWPKPLL